MKMYIWRSDMFLAVAQAESVAEARNAMMVEMGESGDGSCPERDKGRVFILGTMPEIFYSRNAEFVLTNSGELQEQEHYSASLQTQLTELKKSADTPEPGANCPNCNRADVLHDCKYCERNFCHRCIDEHESRHHNMPTLAERAKQPSPEPVDWKGLCGEANDLLRWRMPNRPMKAALDEHARKVTEWLVKYAKYNSATWKEQG